VLCRNLECVSESDFVGRKKLPGPVPQNPASEQHLEQFSISLFDYKEEVTYSDAIQLPFPGPHSPPDPTLPPSEAVVVVLHVPNPD
jgi:hypothetical protein